MATKSKKSKPRVPWPATVSLCRKTAKITGQRMGRVFDDAMKSYAKKIIASPNLSGEFVQSEAEIPR